MLRVRRKVRTSIALGVVGALAFLGVACGPPPPPEDAPYVSPDPVLVCIRAHESANVRPTPYHAYNPAGPYMGAYQYLQSTWDWAAAFAGRPDLVGKPPMEPYVYWMDQDSVTLAVYHWAPNGPGHWGWVC